MDFVDARDQSPKMVDALVERARAMSDQDRLALAAARREVDESFHAGAWRAATEMLSERAGLYASAWQRIGTAYVPEHLEELVQRGDRADPGELREWQDVARLVRLGLDDELLALLTADFIPPVHVRELHMSWRKMLESSRTDAVPT